MRQQRSSRLILRSVGAAAAAAVLLMTALPQTAQAKTTDGPVFISEIHYDNASTDSGEAIEVQAPPGTDLTGWSLVLYNGKGGTQYDTDPLPTPVTDSGVVVVDYPTDGIQNGAPDGVALVDRDGEVVEFLSYEGAFTANGGPASGILSTDIGVAESSNEPIGHSLQKINGAWTGPAASTFGARNTVGGAPTATRRFSPI